MLFDCTSIGNILSRLRCDEYAGLPMSREKLLAGLGNPAFVHHGLLEVQWIGGRLHRRPGNRRPLSNYTSTLGISSSDEVQQPLPVCTGTVWPERGDSNPTSTRSSSREVLVAGYLCTQVGYFATYPGYYVGTKAVRCLCLEGCESCECRQTMTGRCSVNFKPPTPCPLNVPDRAHGPTCS
jgi:hypothetical protein